MTNAAQNWGRWLRKNASELSLPVLAVSLLLLAMLTAAMLALQQFFDVGTVMILYVIAVLFAAIRGGVVPAVVTAVVAIGSAAFFFYPPIYDFRVHNPIHLIDLVLFVCVAASIGKLATDARRARMREQADVLREALIGSVSHELRTPLSSIVGFASVLAQAPEITANAKLAPLVQGLRDEAARLNDHIQNLLDATRITSEGIRPRNEWVDPGDIINAAVERKHTVLANHRVKISVADDLPMLHVDPNLAEKAIGQLLENAAKYSPPHSEIEVRAEPRDDRIRFAVRDQGAGLSAEEHERVWERLYRGPRHRENTAGSGLGLWIARALVIASGGQIEAFSAGIGRGSTFSFYLPVAKHDPAQEEDSDE